MGPDDEARAWDARLGWAFGLIAEDPAERALAVERQAGARRNAHEAHERWNERGREAGALGWEEQRRDPAFVRVAEAHKAYGEAVSRTLPDGLWGNMSGRDIRSWPGLPYALLFLEWEARFPQEWTEHAKAWETKKSLLRRLALAGHDETVRAKLTDLVELVVRRPHRCEDRTYAHVARAVDSEEPRRRLTALAASDEPWVRLNAGCVLRLLGNPGLAVSRHTWNTWLAEAPDGRSSAPRG
ncbi:hypothetical protein [Streptomyces sp. NPDC059247]|uniref:hypothetical protein n=1 Tax=Streptomyces sp. NPDC059247 TaxID=3346790 RepID=UPI003692D239